MLMDRRVKTGFVIVFLLGIPLAITLVLRSANNHYQALPFYGPVEVDKEGDTTYHKLPNFKLASHQGDTLQLKDELADKNFVLHFFTTGCPRDCPEIFRKLKGLGDEYKSLDDLRMISVTLDPQADDIADLKAFEESMDINNDQWHLTRGSTETLNELLTEGLYFKGKADTSTLSPKRRNLTPMESIFLVDKEARIRGAYQGAIQEDFKKLKDEIRVLFVRQNLEYADPK